MLSFFEHTEPKKGANVEVLLRKELAHTIVEYRKDGIVHVTYKSDCTITPKDCRDMAKFIVRIGITQKYNLLTEPEPGSNIDDKARSLLASEKGNVFTLKNAILCNSIVHEMIGNFFIRMDNPTVPTKLFTDKGEAIEWLHYDASKKMVSYTSP